MSGPERTRERVSTLGGAACLVATALLMAGGWILAGAADSPGERAAMAFAALVCLAGSLVGWLLARWPVFSPSRRVAQGLAGMAVRLFVPLFALGWLQVAAPGLRKAGAGEWLLIFYLALLAVDIFLNIIGGTERRKNTGEIPEN
jgi:hypothetical protein